MKIALLLRCAGIENYLLELSMLFCCLWINITGINADIKKNVTSCIEFLTFDRRE